MNMDFANGMRAAMRLIQAQKLMQATRFIRRTRSGGADPEPATEQAAEARAIEGPVIDLTAEVTNLPEGGASLARDCRRRRALVSGRGAWARWSRRMATSGFQASISKR